jgi:hypothetical protein
MQGSKAEVVCAIGGHYTKRQNRTLSRPCLDLLPTPRQSQYLFAIQILGFGSVYGLLRKPSFVQVKVFRSAQADRGSV